MAQDTVGHQGPYRKDPKVEHKHPWWKVMCLTGVDYFSTLAYQAGIAALAAGVISPVATLVLVILTLGGALPIYRRVATESPRGEGSIAMLAHFLPRWGGKLFVLVLLGFAATDFLITMTLSAADATAHLIENPYAPSALAGREVVITLVLLALLGAVFLRGFTEAIGIAVALVGVYLALNVVVVIVGFAHVLAEPARVVDWRHELLHSHGSPWMMVAFALLVFPKLALGLSGFETGVAVMPQIEGDPGETDDDPQGRIRGARKLLTTAALIMSVFLLCTSFITTVLIPEPEFEAGGEANGRALAYLAHSYLGEGFGTVYDLSTIAILWFAGASAMAGLLNLVPRYLPRFGMAPEWASAVRPLVVVFSVIAFAVTIYFKANVDAQSAAYATGVLVLITSAAVAVTMSARRAGQPRRVIAFGLIALVFVYTTVANIFERPDGVRIAGLFIFGIMLVSLLSRVRRAFELRVTDVHLDAEAARFIDEAARGAIQIVAHEPDAFTDVEDWEEEYRLKERQAREENHVPAADPIVFLEVMLTDSSEFSAALDVHGEDREGYRVLLVSSPVIANSVAALLLYVRDRTGVMPHVYFEWTEGNPLVNFLRFIFIGVGEIAPVTREVLRQAEPNRARRPFVHVG